MPKGQAYVEELTWAQARGQVKDVCQRFTAIVDEINPNKELTFFKIKYPYGSHIIHEGTLNVVTEAGQIVSIKDAAAPKTLKESLSYNSVPLGININNGIEVYRELSDRVFSIASWEKGLDLGIWEYMGWTTPYSVSAGARSVYMVPRISLTSGHKKLKREYGITLPAPKRSFDHWQLFSQIINSPAIDVNQRWHCEVMFLSKQWIENLEKYGHKDDNSGWVKLKNYLLEKNLQHSLYGRKRSIFEIVWETFSRSLTNKNLKSNPYVMDTLKHLVFVGTGGAPGSVPNTGQINLAPVAQIQKAYIESYGLKDYIPTVMEPRYINDGNIQSVYYSLQSPTLLESAPKSKNLVSIIDNARELKDLTEHFLSEAFDDYIKIENKSINKMIENLRFEVFHEEPYAYGQEIRPSNEMPKGDVGLIYSPIPDKNKKFADTSPYLHGCIRISSNKNDK